MNDSDYNTRLKMTGRNDPCLCGSGKKYKKCHLPEDELIRHRELTQATEEREAALKAEELKAHPGNTTKAKNPMMQRDIHQQQRKASSSRDRHTNIPRRGAI